MRVEIFGKSATICTEHLFCYIIFHERRKDVKTIDSEILCPFYIKEGNQTVTCEGLIPGTYATQRFPDYGTKRFFEQSSCCRLKEHTCPHADALRRSYECGDSADA